MTRFVFYDFETTGTSVTYAQPLQFAAIVTDENFNVLDTVDWRCRIAPHILPAPYALKVTNLAPEQVTNNNLQTAFDFAQCLYQFLEKWQPAIWIGYNTIKFEGWLAFVILRKCQNSRAQTIRRPNHFHHIQT